MASHEPQSDRTTSDPISPPDHVRGCIGELRGFIPDGVLMDRSDTHPRVSEGRQRMERRYGALSDHEWSAILEHLAIDAARRREHPRIAALWNAYYALPELLPTHLIPLDRACAEALSAWTPEGGDLAAVRTAVAELPSTPNSEFDGREYIESWIRAARSSVSPPTA